MSDDARRRALERIVELASEHHLGLREIEAALSGEPLASGAEARRTVLTRVLGYLGGTFVFAGLGVFIAMQWDAMNSAARVIITLGPGLAAFVMALLARRDERFDKATTPLLLIAAVLEPLGMMVAFHEFGGGGDWRVAQLVTAATMALQFGLTLAWLGRATLLFVTLVFALVAAATGMDLLAMEPNVIGLTLGVSTLLVTAGIERTRYALITPFWYFAASVAALTALFDMVEKGPFELLFPVAAAACVYLSVQLRSRTLLLVSTLAILLYTGYFTNRHFADSLGWPIALIIFGLLLIGLSAMALRIDRRYLRGGGRSEPS